MSLRHIAAASCVVVLTLTLFGLAVHAQPNEAAVTPTPQATPTYPRGFDLASIETAKQFLRKNAAERSMRPDLSDLTVSRLASDLGIDHVWFQQFYQGIPVYLQEIGVHIRKDGRAAPYISGNYEPRVILQPGSGPYPAPGSNTSSTTPSISISDAVSRASSALNVKGTLSKPATAGLVIYPVEKSGKDLVYALTWGVTLYPLDPRGDWEVFIHAKTGQVLSKINRGGGDLEPAASSTPAPRDLPAVAVATATRALPPSATIGPPQTTPTLPIKPTGPASPQTLPRTIGTTPQPVDARNLLNRGSRCRRAQPPPPRPLTQP
jgi:hypothetical protein